MKSNILQLRSLNDRLGVRLAFVLAIALLPLMIVSIVRSHSVMNEAEARSQATLVGETLRVVRQEAFVIERAKAVSQALSNSMLQLLDDPEQCNQTMLAQLKDSPFSFAGFYDITGFVPCSSAPEPFAFEMSPQLQALLENPRQAVHVNTDAPVSGTSVVYASSPVFDETGALYGFTSVSVPHRRLHQLTPIESEANFLTLNASGALLTAPGTLEEAQSLLPSRPLNEIISEQPGSFRAVGKDGQERLYAFAPVVEGELYALSTWPLDSGLNRKFYLRNPALFPALMWLASLGVAWFATSVFVTQHVVRLRKSMQAFAAKRTLTPAGAFLNAPKELRDVADTFDSMTQKVMQDEAQIEDALRQKDILLREVHHRVKNNLQLIASIMSMQMRQSRSKEVKHLMQSLHDRVNSLATIHQNLYQTSGQADIIMDEHLDAIVRQVFRMAAARDAGIALDTDFAQIRLNPDQAVPLSLFVTEAMTNALKYIGADDGAAKTLSVSLHVLEADMAEVKIVNSITSAPIETDADTSSGLGSELMEAFAEQLSGTFSAKPNGTRFAVYLRFQIEPLVAKP